MHVPQPPTPSLPSCCVRRLAGRRHWSGDVHRWSPEPSVRDRCTWRSHRTGLLCGGMRPSRGHKNIVFGRLRGLGPSGDDRGHSACRPCLALPRRPRCRQCQCTGVA